MRLVDGQAKSRAALVVQRQAAAEHLAELKVQEADVRALSGQAVRLERHGSRGAADYGAAGAGTRSAGGVADAGGYTAALRPASRFRVALAATLALGVLSTVKYGRRA
jgi:hypothetical protein